MRQMTEQEMIDVARGSAILATGGGGDPYLGIIAVQDAIEEFGLPNLITVDELEDDALVVTSAVLGAPVPLVEKMTFGPEMVAAFEALQQVLGRRASALLPIEAGGLNAIVPFVIAARAGVPVVDADMMGRAFPEMNLVTLTLHGLGACPLATADENGNTVIFNAIDTAWTERLARPVATEFGACTALCGYPLSGAQVKMATVHDSISHAQRIGEAVRVAGERHEDPIAALLAAADGYELFRGKITDVDRQEIGGWSMGEATITPFGDDDAEPMVIQFQNENLIARVGEEVYAIVPDLMTMVDAETGRAVTTEHLRYGLRVAVVGMRADKQWRTPAGIELAGPRHFNYDVDYVPIEELVARRGERAGAGAGS